MAGQRMSGGCACGRIRFEADIESTDAYLCHCRMCQRASGNVSLAMIGVRQDAVRWSREPDWYESSPIARRPFCSGCGTTLGFLYNELGEGAPATEKMDLTVAAFDDPSPFRPTSHFGMESVHRAWLHTEGLPETRSDDYQPLRKRWEKAGAEPPSS